MKINYSLVFFLFVGILSVDVDAQIFSGGDGSAEDPWQISTPSHLNNIRGYSGDYFVLINDVDLSFDTGHPDGQFWYDGYGWQPIGIFGENFVINLNGNGFKISGLTIGDGSPNGSGLFGTIFNSKISNLGLTDIDIKVKNHYNSVGGIAGFSDNSTIDQCFTSGVISGAGDAGGLVGVNKGVILNSYADVDIINPFGLTGGLVGDNLNGAIHKSYSLGFIEQLFSFWDDNHAVAGDGIVEDTYFNIETVGQTYGDDDGNGVRISSLIDKNSTIRSLDFSDSGAWKIQQDTTYPLLKWQIEPDSINYPTKTPLIHGLETRSRTYGTYNGWQEPSTEQPLGYNIYKWGRKVNTKLVPFSSFKDSTIDLGKEILYQVTALYLINGDTLETNLSAFDATIAGFSDGKGKSHDPYKIRQMDQFEYMKQDLDGYFAMDVDINAAETRNWNEGKGFSPIKNFSGSFDGKGSFSQGGTKIDSLYINRPDQDSVGLFSNSDGEIVNMGLTNAMITGNDHTGGIVGVNTGTINNFYVTGLITGSINVGGVTGTNNGFVNIGYTEVNVDGIRAIGGIVGLAENQQIENTYTLGRVTGENGGPIIGEGQDNIPATNYYNTSNYTGGELTNLLGSSLEESQMRDKSSFVAFDFDNDWNIIDGFSYPFLRSNIQNPLPGYIDPFAGGIGTPQDPYQISNNVQFNAIRYFLDKHYVLINDLDLTLDTSDPQGLYWNSGKGWLPIGEGFEGFNGSLDGMGYTIKGLSILNASGNSNAVFTRIEEEAVIWNVLFDTLTVLGGNSGGGIVHNNFGTLHRVGVSGKIEITGEAGGIVAYNQSTGVINESYFVGEVTSTLFNAGGLMAYSNGKVANSYSLTSVTGGTISIGLSPYAGGLIGFTGTGSTVLNSFHIGEVVSLGTTGGLFGRTDDATVTYSYWDTEISGIENGVAEGIDEGTFGLTSAQMRDQNSFENWDFDSVWVMQPFAVYPTLQWNPESFPMPLPDSVSLIFPDHDSLWPIFEIEFTWTSSEYANEYKFQLATDSLFEAIVVDLTTADTTLVLEDGILEGNEKYYWKVNAVNKTGESNWSEVFYFFGEGGLSTNKYLELPKKFALFQNYPNPFNPSTTINFDLPVASNVKLIVYDMLGREVSQLINDKMEAGYHQIIFRSQSISSGMYIYKIITDEFVHTKKMLLIK